MKEDTKAEVQELRKEIMGQQGQMEWELAEFQEAMEGKHHKH